jgi:hypothetical protein
MSDVFSSGDRQEHILSTGRMTYRPKWMDKGVLTLTWKSVVMSEISFCKLITVTFLADIIRRSRGFVKT